MKFKQFRLKYKIPMIVGGISLFVGVITTLVMSNLIGNEASTVNNQILKNQEQIAESSREQVDKNKNRDITRSGSSQEFIPINVQTTLANRFDVPTENINMSINNALSAQSTTNNITFSNSNNAVAFSNYNFTMPIYQYANHHPLNENLNEFNNRTNEYIGYQVFNNNGTDISRNNYGFTINDRFEQIFASNNNQQTSRDQIVSQFEGTPLRLNNGDLSIFAMEFPGAKSAFGNSTISVPPNLVVNNSILAKAPYITGITNFQDGSETIFNKFFFNMLVANTNGVNSFFAPRESMNAIVAYNGSTSGNITTNQSPAEFVNDTNNRNNFSVSVSQAINHTNDYFKIELIPRVSTVEVNLTITNYVEVTNVFLTDINNNTTQKSIYTIVPSKTFDNILTLRGFNPSKKVNINGTDITTIYDDATKNNSFLLGDATNETSIGMGSAILNQYNNGDTTVRPNKTNIWDFEKTYPVDMNRHPQLNNAVVPFATFNKAQRPNSTNFGNKGVFDKNNVWANNTTNNNNIWAMPYYSSQLLSNSFNKITGQKIPYHTGIFTPDTGIPNQDIGNWAFTTENGFTGSRDFMPLGTNRYLQTASDNYAMDFLGRTNNETLIPSLQSLPIYLNYRVRNDSVLSTNPRIKQMMYLMRGNTPIIDIEYGKGSFGSYYAANNNDATAIFEYLCGIISTDYLENKSYWMVPSESTNIAPLANGGIDPDSIANFSPSQWIQSQDNLKNIKININGGIAETVQLMNISLTPNDLDGTLIVAISPGNGVRIDRNLYPHNANVAEVAPLEVPEFSFTISGFSVDRNVNDTIIESPNNWDITFLPDFFNAYITFGINNYLEPNQSISNLVIGRQEEIIANVISANYRNLYNVRTNELLNPFENGQPSSALLSQVRDISITIPSALSGTGYNHLDLKFSLQGIAKNGVISTNFSEQNVRIMFKQPDRVATYFNDNISVYSSTTENTTNPYFNPVADNILNTILDPANIYSNKYPLFNYLVSGYWDINSHWIQKPDLTGAQTPQVDFGGISNFKLTVPDIDINNPDNSKPDIVKEIPFLRSQWIFGYPSDYYLPYNGQNNLLATNDELSPSNWTFSAPSIDNNGVLNFNLVLPYLVNNQGLIVKSGVLSSRTISGYLLDKNLNTLLTQVLFNSPVNTVLPSEWVTIQNQLYNMVERTITNLPVGSSISLVPSTISNLDGTISFNVYSSQYYINGIVYTNTSNNRSLGVVTFTGFKHAQVTSIQSTFRATSSIIVNNNPTLPSNLAPSAITQMQLIEILKNDGFINLPNNAIISIADFSKIQVNGLNGEIRINPSTMGLTVNQYYNDQGLLVSSPSFAWPQSIVITGFQISQPTTLSSQNFTLSNNDQVLATFSEAQAKNIAISLLENLPRNFSIDNDMKIIEFKKFYNHIPGDPSSPSLSESNTATFKIELTNYFDDNGNIATIPKIFPIDDASNDFAQVITVTGFKTIGATIVSGSYTIADFSTMIASNYVNNFAITNESIKSKILEFIFPLVINAPDALVLDDLSLGQVQSVDNIDGSIRVTVLCKKVYNAKGELATTTNNLIGDVTFGGFKKLPSSPTTPLNSTNNEFSVNLSTVIPDENYTSAMIQSLLFDNLGLFLKNPPPILVNVADNKDVPQIKLNNLIISNIVRDIPAGKIAVDVKLSSFYATQNNVNGVVWVSTTNPTEYKDIGKVTINGFRQYKKTDINSTIDVRTLVPDIYSNKLASEITLEQIRLLVKDNAIINPPNNLLDSEIVIDSRRNNNLQGTIVVSVILTRYINEAGMEINEGLEANISIIGFQTVRPTTIANSIQTPNANIYAYQFDQTNTSATIRNLILSHIDSPAPNTTIDNLILETPPVINNFTGTITIFRPQLNNYYDSNGAIGTTNRVFNDITIFGFKIVSQSTSIISEYNMQSPQLPIEYFEFLTNLNNPSTALIQKLKNLVLNNNFFNGAPENLTTNDFDLTIREINNISGTARISIQLKRYFDASGQLIQVTDPSTGPDYLTQNILLTNFVSIIETDLRPTIAANNPTILPSDFVQNDASLKQLIFDRAIIGRWTTFTQSDFEIKNKVANNLLGTATIEVEFLKYIDANGIYRSTNVGQGLIRQIIITGLRQVQQTRISEDISYYLKAPTIPEFFIRDEPALKNYIFSHLIINKTNNMSENDIRIISSPNPDGTAQFGQFDNLSGTVNLQAQLTNNYYDANGMIITNNVSSPIYNVTIILDQTTAPTSIISSQDISNYSSMDNGNDVAWSSKSASEFASTDINSMFLNATQDKLFNITNFKNNNQQYGEIGGNNTIIPYNYQDMILRNIPFFKDNSNHVANSLQQTDISYRQQTAANGITYYGTPNNVDGTLTLTIRLTRYYDQNGVLVETTPSGNPKPVLELNTVLTGFKKTTQKPVEVINITPANNSLSHLTAKEASINLNSTSNLANLIIDKGIINWEASNKNNNFLIIGLTSIDNINGTLVVDFRIRDFVDETGLNYVNWSKNYSILISGFKETKQTTLTSNFTLIGTAVNPEFVNLDRNINYNAINLHELANSNPPERVQEWIYQIVHANLNNLIVHQSNAIMQLANNSFNYNNMLQYITINNITLNSGTGIVDFDFLLYSYFSNNNGELVQQSTPLVTHMYLDGFYQTRPTTIVPTVNTTLLKDVFATDWATNHSTALRQFIISNQNLFFNNQPFNLRIFDIDVTDMRADPLIGSLTFKLSLSNYFNFAGDISSSPRLERDITLLGFKRTAETEVSSTINLRDYPANAAGSLDRSLERLTSNNLRNFIFTYSNFNSAPIITNIPPNFSEGNILDLTFIPNYALGQVDITFKLNNYYNDSGLPTTNIPKEFKLKIVGFSIINEVTSILPTADVSSTPLANQIVSNIDNDNIKEYFSNYPSLLTSLTQNLPLTFNSNPLGSNPDYEINVIPGSQNPTMGSIKIEIKIFKYFAKVNDAINLIERNVGVTSPLIQEVTLTGFRGVQPTAINNNTWNLSTAGASDVTVGTMDSDLLTRYADNQNIKSLYLDNPIRANNIITTEVHVSEITERDVGAGTLKAKVYMKNYYGTNGLPIITNSPEQLITFTGFKAQPPYYGIQASANFNLTNLSANLPIASVYAQNTTNIMEYLNARGEDNTPRIVSMIANAIGSNNSRQPQVTEIVGLDGGNQIFVNDREGEVKFQVKVINMINENGLLETNPEILKDEHNKPIIITLNGLPQCSPTTWKNKDIAYSNNINLSSSNTVQDFSPDLNTLRRSIIEKIELGSEGNITQEIHASDLQINTLSKKENEKSGIVSYQITVSNWWDITTNNNQYSQFTQSSSILTKGTMETSEINIVGLTSFNADTQNFLFIFSISAASVILFVLLVMVVYLVYRKWRVN